VTARKVPCAGNDRSNSGAEVHAVDRPAEPPATHQVSPVRKRTQRFRQLRAPIRSRDGRVTRDRTSDCRCCRVIACSRKNAGKAPAGRMMYHAVRHAAQAHRAQNAVVRVATSREKDPREAMLQGERGETPVPANADPVRMATTSCLRRTARIAGEFLGYVARFHEVATQWVNANNDVRPNRRASSRFSSGS